MSKFQKATKKKSRLRMAIHGPSGAGKTYTALAIAKHLGNKIAVIDTEAGSASKYSDIFDFDVLDMSAPYHPNRLVEAIVEAGEEYAGDNTIVIDSMTHFWNGPGGMLELVEQEAKRSSSKNTFAAWKSVDPLYRRVIQAILSSPSHVIFCIRAKQEYAQETSENGKKQVTKLGMSPEMRNDFQYEADVEAMLNMSHDLIIGKTRCPEIDGKVYTKAGKDVATILRGWLDAGVDVPAANAVPTDRPTTPEIPSSKSAVIMGQASAERLCDDLVAKVVEASDRASAIAIKDKAKAAFADDFPDLLGKFRRPYEARLVELRAAANGAPS